MARMFEWIVAEDDEGKNRVVLQHYGDPGVRTRVFESDELIKMDAWEIASRLNSAYEAGRTHAMEELRRFIGIK